MNRLRIVLDTNILLVCLPTKSKYRLIFDKLLAGEYEISITNEILSEYMEILEHKTSVIVAKNIGQLFLNLDNVIREDIYFKWSLINADKDDNKFVDCAIATNSDFIVTNDKHFNILKTIEFPKLNIINIDELKTIL